MENKVIINPLSLVVPDLFRIWVKLVCDADSPYRKVFSGDFTVADLMSLNVNLKEDERFA